MTTTKYKMVCHFEEWNSQIMHSLLSHAGTKKISIQKIKRMPRTVSIEHPPLIEGSFDVEPNLS